MLITTEQIIVAIVVWHLCDTGARITCHWWMQRESKKFLDRCTEINQTALGIGRVQ